MMIATALFFKRGLTIAPPLRTPRVANFAMMGVVNAFLPCGLLVAALGLAAGSGSALGGAAVMGAFGATTVLVFAVAGKLRPKRPIPIRGLACLAGLLLVLRGMALDIPYISPTIQDGQPACQNCVSP